MIPPLARGDFRLRELLFTILAAVGENVQSKKVHFVLFERK